MIRILHVDDESQLIEITKIFLERMGDFEVIPVTSAKDALTILEENGIDVIISDYQMPKMDGIELLKIIRERRDDRPFILFTGRGREEVAIEALNLGADRYIQKGGDPRPSLIT